ncbi:hypothetical protein EGW08_010465 [Elysia chlorotica]|uniref:Hexosyltransferase n=1 Tax=Elysia chlorotica TaxID=188477 RepID=A0A433TJM4_ELYCH|nr:hypothetical protein EGW08_010465 [Elysia chlorotica]
MSRIFYPCQRRGFRQTITVLAFLAMLAIALKLQHMVFNLNENHDADDLPKSARAKALTKSTVQMSKGEFGAEQEPARLFVKESPSNDGKAFAQLGIKLVNISLHDKSTKFNSSFRFPLFNGIKLKTVAVADGLKTSWLKGAKILPTKMSMHQTMNVSSYSTNKYVSMSKINSVEESRVAGKRTRATIRLSETVQNQEDKPVLMTTNINSMVSTQHTDSFTDLYLAIIIVSRPENMLHRLATRKTWARNARALGTVLRFIVGRDPSWDSLVEEESDFHKDLIILEEDDVYDLLPTKVLEGLTWALRQDVRPEYVMKVDDDSIVNLPYLLTELHGMIINSTQILGAICKNAPVVRDPSDKWSVSVLDYPLDKNKADLIAGVYSGMEIMNISS